MLPCTFHDRIGQYHDGELPSARASEVEVHLVTCEMCARELAGLRELSRQVAGLPRPRVSVEVIARLHSLADAHVEQASRDAMRIGTSSEPVSDRGVLRFVRALSAVAASVLVTATVGVFVASTASFKATMQSTATGAASPSGWEQLAVSIHTPDSVAGAATATGTPLSGTSSSIETAEWIVSGLSGNGND